jgi:hypothetical protein
MIVGRGPDALGLYLTGGASNTDPDASLGGVPSSVSVRGLGAILGARRIPAIAVRNVFPACGEGDALLEVDSTGTALLFTPPDGLVGPAFPVGEGETAIIHGSDVNKAIKVYREAGLSMAAGLAMDLALKIALNGVLSQGNLTSAERAAGKTSYRALMLSAHGDYDVTSIAIWFPSSGQSTWSVGAETPDSNGNLQTIPNETTAPSGVSWTTPVSESGALTIATLAKGETLGLWIRRVFPASGVVAPQENVQMTFRFDSVR